MLRSYLLLAFRNIRRQKLYSIISVGCLATGIMVCMIIMLYVLHEHSYDNWQKDSKRIFAVSVFVKMGGSGHLVHTSSYGTGPSAMREDGGVQGYVRAYPAYKPRIGMSGSPVADAGGGKGVLFADSNFFRFFNFYLLQGNASQVLLRPNAVVLTERAAAKFFGKEDPVGKILLYNDSIRLEVLGVSANPPSNSNINFDYVASIQTLSQMEEARGLLSETGVSGGNFLTWLLLKDPAQYGHVERTMQRLAGTDGDGTTYTFPLTALPDQHLDEKYADQSNVRYLQIFSCAAMLVLALSLVNYMGLAVSRGISRSKEVGVRKALGAGRATIAGQFYTESALYAILSFAGGGIGCLMIKPMFCRLLQVPIDGAFLQEPLVLVIFALLLIFVVVVAGSYPALVLSAYNPIVVLYGRIFPLRNKGVVRKGFVIFQFSLSAGLLFCSIVILRQLNYIRHVDTGIDRENILVVGVRNTEADYAVFKREVEALAGVEKTAISHYLLYKDATGMLTPAEADRPGFNLSFMQVDSNFISLLGLKWKYAPLRFSDLYQDRSVVMNEAAAARLGLSENAAGRRVMLDGPYILSGVLKDFNYSSLHDQVGPMALFISGQLAHPWMDGGYLYVKVRAHTNLPDAIAAIRRLYEAYDPKTVFSYRCLDEDFDGLYQAEDRLAALFTYFTVIAVFIGCLGLFALATFSAEQRIKEIGIRKVLGASVGGLVGKLSGDFLQPVVLALIIAFPLAGWMMRRWLEDFAFRTSIGWWVFPLTGGVLLVMAFVTVFFQSWRAAKANPVKNLRVE